MTTTPGGDPPLALLLVEDSSDDAELLLRALKPLNRPIDHVRVDREEQLIEALESRSWDLLISDWVVPQMRPSRTIELAHERGFEGPVIVVSGTMGEDLVVEALRGGAHDYVLKGNLRRLVPAIERELREAESRASARRTDARYRNLLETLPAAVYIDRESKDADSGYTTQFASPQIETLLGYPPAAFERDPDLWWSLVHPDDRERVLDVDRTHFASGEPIQHEFRMITKDGRVIWILDHAAIVEDDPAGVRSSQGVLTDITERKEREEERRRDQERLLQLDEQRRELLTRLVTIQNEERRRIAIDMHDDTIQAITAWGIRLGALGLAHPELKADERFVSLETGVVDVIRGLRHLLFQLHPETLDSAGLVVTLRAHLSELERSADVPRYELESTLRSEPEPEQRLVLYRIAQEAISNARRHARPSLISVRLGERDGGYALSVRDDGRGFDPALSEPSGHLGLTSMRERAELADGRCSVESREGAGTTVEVWLPGRPVD